VPENGTDEVRRSSARHYLTARGKWEPRVAFRLARGRAATRSSAPTTRTGSASSRRP